MKRSMTFNDETWERLVRVCEGTEQAEVSLAARIVTLFMWSADPRLTPDERGTALALLDDKRREVQTMMRES